MQNQRTNEPAALHSHRQYLFGLCYRMTGCAADAEEIVQETFARAIERPPAQQSEIRPWLVTVAVNQCKDLLRKRRNHYIGPWLPSPIDTDELDEPMPSYEPNSAESRYSLLESVSVAFLLALEVLKPKERAVLILRDVFDYSIEETAKALSISEANVKVIHFRVRKQMSGYDEQRATKALRQAQEQQALFQFVTALSTGDVDSLLRLLSENVRSVSDGGGEFSAARVIVTGREKIIAMYLKLTRLREGTQIKMSPRVFNGSYALVLENEKVLKTDAPRSVTRVELNESGQIIEIQTVLATRKLSAVSHLP